VAFQGAAVAPGFNNTPTDSEKSSSLARAEYRFDPTRLAGLKPYLDAMRPNEDFVSTSLTTPR
jgi:hypothetical protein